jgi:single-stranded-DNA-specific exonuclease
MVFGQGSCFRLGIEVVVIDHHRIQQKADTLAVWSEEFCGAGLAAMFMTGMAERVGWTGNAIEKLIEGTSLYAAVASVADCVPLLGKTRTLTKLGLTALAQTRHCGMRELLKVSTADPLAPDSQDVAFRIAPRINAAGRVDHPAAALAVVQAASIPKRHELRSAASIDSTCCAVIWSKITSISGVVPWRKKPLPR